jgi:predicted component of type VI protein secretion system
LIGREDAFFRPSAQHCQLPFAQAIHMNFQPSSVKDFLQFREGSEGALHSLADFFSGDVPCGHPHHPVREI